MSSNPKISVIIPCYNLGQYINEAIESVLNQTFQDFEIIVINDGSTDEETIKILNDINNERVKVISTDNQGLAKARNHGISLSKGALICCLDADDKLDPTYFQKVVEIFDKDKSIGIVSSWLQEFGISNGVWNTSDNVLDLIKDNCLTVASVFRKECWEEVGGYDPYMPAMGYEDWDFWISISERGWKIEVIEEYLFYYRIRENSMLGDASKKRIDLVEYIYKKHHKLISKYYSDIILQKEKNLVCHREVQQNMKSKYESLIFQIESKLLESNKQLLESKKVVDQLRHENDILKQSKFHRLRESIKRDKFSPRKLIRIVYLLLAIITPEALRSRLRSPIKQLKHYISRKIYTKHFTQILWPINMPLVSVVIPCFNYGEYVEEAIDSVLAQTFQDFEIIVVDGGSTDNKTTNILRKLDKPKTKVYFREEPHLAGSNRNFGISKAKGKYICCLDADDKLKPTYLEKAVFSMELENLDLLSPSLEFFGQKSGEVPLPHTYPTLENLTNYNCFYSVSIFTKKYWEKVGGYVDYGKGADHIPEDWDFWVKLMAFGARVKAFVREPLMLYRKHGNASLSEHSDIPSYEELSKLIKKHNESNLTQTAISESNNINRLRYKCINPTINLSRFPTKNNTALFILPYTVIGGADKRFQQLVNLIKDKINVGVITTLDFDKQKMIDTTKDYEGIISEVFNLPRFLENQEQYRDFIFYYLSTRNVKTIYMGGSEYFYQLIPEVKQVYPHIKIIDMQFNTTGHFVNNRKYSKYIDITIAENDEVKDKIVNEFKDDPKKVIQILSGVDTKYLSKEDNKIDYPETLPKDKKIVSYLGRWSEEKGPDIFLKIAERFKSNNDIAFVLCGGGPMQDTLMDYINTHDLTNVIVAGMIDSRQYMAHSTVMILPSRLDGRPYALLEALSMGLPVIGSNVGGIPDIILDEETGLLCKAEDIDDFASAINRLVYDEEFREMIAKNSREYAVENFDIEKENKAYLDLFLK